MTQELLLDLGRQFDWIGIDAASGTGTFTFGPTISRAIALSDGTRFVPFATVTGIWTFRQTNTATALSSQSGLAEEGLRARVEAGFNLANDNGLSLSVSGSYGGKVDISRSF